MTRNLMGLFRAAAFLSVMFLAARAQAVTTSTLVQGQGALWGNANSWADGPPANPGPTGSAPTTGDGHPVGTVPNSPGAIVYIQQVAGVVQTPAVNTAINTQGTKTIGQLIVNNTTNNSRTVISGTKLIFDNNGADALWDDNKGSVVPAQNTWATRMNLPVEMVGNLIMEIDQQPNFNTATTVTNVIIADANETLTKRGDATIQFEYNVTPSADSFLGNLVIENGAVRLINGAGTGAGGTNSVFNKAASITVQDNTQLQLGNSVPSFTIANGGEVKLNGLGNNNADLPAYNDGALRFEQEVAGHTIAEWNAKVRLQTQSKITVAASVTTANMNKEITGDGTAGLTKGGAGLMRLMNPDGNTYAGQTNVSNGAVAVNNTNSATSGVGSGNVFVNNGGKLGGIGTIGTVGDTSNVSVSDGTLAPGDFSINQTTVVFEESAGALTVNGDVSMTNQSIFNIDLGATSDQLVANGSVALGNATLNLVFGGSFDPTGSYTLISKTAVGAISGIFNTVQINGAAAAGPDFVLNGETYHLSYASGDGNDLVLLAGATPTGLPGDFNDDEVVNSADYVLWRKLNGTASTLNGNGDETGGSMGQVDAADYSLWVKSYGNVAAGGGSGGSQSAPEPGSCALALLALCFGFAVCKRR